MVDEHGDFFQPAFVLIAETALQDELQTIVLSLCVEMQIRSPDFIMHFIDHDSDNAMILVEFHIDG